MMAQTILHSLLIMFLSHSVIISGKVGQPENCLLEGKVLYEETGECARLLEQGPCDWGQQMVIGVRNEGVCKEPLSCEYYEVEIIDPEKGVACGCPEGKVRILGKCQTLFAKAFCLPGRILVPQQFTMDREGKDLTCPDEFSCKPSTDCDSYRNAKKDLGQLSGTVRGNMISHLKNITCNKTQKKICCPQASSKSLLTSEIIVKSLKISSKTKCITNPCPSAQWPWIDEDGQSLCVRHSEDLNNCKGTISVYKSVLDCLDLVSGYPVVLSALSKPKDNCGRRRRWSRYHSKCVRIFS